MKYESGENFASMALRYKILLDLLNYSEIKVAVPKLQDGQLIESLRKSSYKEATERLLILYAYGIIDEVNLRKFTLGKPIKCDDIIAAEQLVLSLENKETEKGENAKYVEIDADVLDLKAFTNALHICAASANSDFLSDISFMAAYKICSEEHRHITMKNGYCFPDSYLYKFALKTDLLLKYSASTDKIEKIDSEEVDDMPEDDIKESIIFRDINAAAFIEAYIERLFGRDYIEYCIDNSLPMEIDDVKYMSFLKEKKLCFDFIRYSRKHNYFISKYNHLDYDVIKTEGGKLISITEEQGEPVSLRIDASSVNNDDTPKDIIQKILKQNADTFPLEGTLMKTSYNGKEYAFAYSKGKYSEIDVNLYSSNLVDYERILSLINIFSEKHLIRLSGDMKNVEIIMNKGGVDYRQQNEITDNEFEAIKGVIREQLTLRFALERKKTEGLRQMSQLKVEAEKEKREEAIKAKEEEERKQRKKEEEHNKREGRKKNGE